MNEKTRKSFAHYLATSKITHDFAWAIAIPGYPIDGGTTRAQKIFEKNILIILNDFIEKDKP